MSTINEIQLRLLLSEVASGTRSVDDAWEKLRHLGYEELGFACLDHQRRIRTGIPEVVFASGKTASQVIEILTSLFARNGKAIATRVSADTAARILEKFPTARAFESARMVAIGEFIPPQHEPSIAVVSAGTSDMPVAEEAAVTIELLGTYVHRVYDVGVAGLHRLLDKLELLKNAKAVVAVAGMEGALPSVLGGFAGRPIIGVPTSVGYGANFGGISALLTMLNSCSPGVAVVNIDNGFGAAVMAHIIAKGGE